MADFTVNFEAAVTFLKLAVEQMRAVDAPAATYMQEHFQVPLQQAFEHYFKHVDFDNLNVFEKTTSMKLVQLGQQLLEKQVRNRPALAPPGLGFKLFRESRLANSRICEWPETDPQDQLIIDAAEVKKDNYPPHDSIWHTPCRFRKASPFGVIGDKRGVPASSNSSPAELAPRKRDDVTGHEWSAVASPTKYPTASYPTRQLTPPDEPGTETKTYTEETTGVAEPFSWAEVAALPANAPVATINLSGKVNRMKDTPPNPGPRFIKHRIPKETEQETKRVVWAVNLPRGTSLRDISKRIDVGPVMSILLQYDINESYPGTSACIIFQKAESAVTCVTSRKLCWTDEINVFLGPGFPMDEDVQSMDIPTVARRRLKWSHSQLFHSVSLREFKKDIFDICSVDNVELVHFYNPGEATIIFSSVSVATFVMNRFRNIAKGFYSKYRHVDVNYARDFNERPPGDIKSSYDTNNSVRRVPFDGAMPGIYPGPLVQGK